MQIPQNTPISYSAIGQHLLDTRYKICAEKFKANWFAILTTGLSSFHLAMLKSVFIESLDLSLCCQKEFVLGQKLLHLLRK